MGAKQLIALALMCVLPVTTGYYCLEYYIPLGTVLHDVSFTHHQQNTSGELARECNSYCDADRSCTATWSTSAVSTNGPACKLLGHTADDVVAALQPSPGQKYPKVQPNFTALPGSEEKSLSWLCLKQQEDWDTLGTTSSSIARPGAQDATWCAYGTDSAGYNLDDWQGSRSLQQCAERCANISQCSMWISRPLHCWLKYSALVGADGWTGAYRRAWLDHAVEPNAAITCFKRLQDWRELGQQLSPNLASTKYKDLWYTLYPERVNHSEAAEACRHLPGGRLAQLTTQEALDAVGNALLPTLPMQYTLQVAWVGARGILDASTATILTGDQAPQQPSTADGSGLVEVFGTGNHTVDAAEAAAAGGSVPTWQAHHLQVNTNLFTHPSEHYLQWRGSDSSFRQYVPQAGHRVCVAVLGVPPPSVVTEVTGQKGRDAPGLYLFTCRRPTAFICESPKPPEVLPSQMGRVVPHAALVQAQANTNSSSSPPGPNSQQLALAIVLPVLAVLLLCVWLSTVCCRQLRGLMRHLDMQRKRALGLPSKGVLTVAVTDIQGYTHFSETHPQAMGQALLQHNQVIREAAYANAGHVLAQEGDAFILGFSDALDAAVFALQVQLRLMQVDFPAVLRYDDDEPNTQHLTQSAGNLVDAAKHDQQQQPNTHSISTGAAGRRSHTNQPHRLPGHHQQSGGSTQGDAVIELPPRSTRNNTPWSSLPPVAQTPCGSGSSASSAAHSRPLRELRWPWSITAAATNGSTSKQPSNGALHTLSAWDAGRSRPLSSSGSSSNSARRHSSVARVLSSAGSWWKQLIPPQGPQALQLGLFRGLRVRVGLATGAISRGHSVETTLPYSMARVISECAAGGQVLLDAATFEAVRGELHLLGAVTAGGVDFTRLQPRRREAAALACGQHCGSCPCSHHDSQSAARDAVVLDMGMYETPLCMLPSNAVDPHSFIQHPSFTPSLQLTSSLAQSAGLQQQSSSQADAWARHQAANQQQSLQQQQPQSVSSIIRQAGSFFGGGRSQVGNPSSTSPSAEGSIERAAPCRGRVRLYELSASELAGRLVVFGDRLALPAAWRCLDPPYFAAPGLCGVGDWLQQSAKRAVSSTVPAPADSLGHCDQAMQRTPSAQQQQDLASPFSRLPPAQQQPQPATSRSGASGQQLTPTTHAGVSSQAAGSSALQSFSPGSTLAAIRALSVNASWPGMQVAHAQGASQPQDLHPCYPTVSVVFVAVEGAEALQQQHHPSIGRLHALLSELMLEACALLHGYLVKAYEAELKYMATFNSASAAVEWCLLLQEAALHLPYPAELLQQRLLRSVCDADGVLLFRGARLKMGVGEGSPTCIIPDHRGRADYLGTCVNQAARLADAAAHGGQVALEEGLANKVWRHWQHSQPVQQQVQAATAAAGPGHCPFSAGLAAPACADDSQVQPLGPMLARGWSSAESSSTRVAVQVVMQQLGCFLFKGCAKSMTVLSFLPQKLASRKFPAAAPRGKGVRLSHTCGVMDVVDVLLPRQVADLQVFSDPVA